VWSARFHVEARLQAMIGGYKREFIAYSGAGVSILKPGVYYSKIRPTEHSTMAATGNVLDFIGEQDVPLALNGRTYGHTFCVNYFLVQTDEILGMNFLTATGAILDLGRRRLRLWKCPSLSSVNIKRSGASTEVNHTILLRTPLKSTSRVIREPRITKTGGGNIKRREKKHPRILKREGREKEDSKSYRPEPPRETAKTATGDGKNQRIVLPNWKRDIKVRGLHQRAQ
jgi:hypothetical protein